MAISTGWPSRSSGCILANRTAPDYIARHGKTERFDALAGSLVEVLENCRQASTPIFLLYQCNRQLSPRARVFYRLAGRRLQGR